MIQAAMTMSVLVVDDEPAVLEMLGRTLGRAGFAPAMAVSGEQALELMQAQQFDAALVDKNLKGMDGIDLLRHVRKRQPRCACIVMTAYPSTSSAVEALRLGVLDYVEKPSPELDLIADRIQLAIRSVRLREERDGLAKEVTSLQAQLKAREGLISQHTIEVAMTGELIDIRVAEVAETLARSVRERDEKLIGSAEQLLAQVKGLKGMTALAAAIESHLAALKAPTPT